jgi:hypothetical protein
MKLGWRLTVAQMAGLAILGAMLAYFFLWVMFLFYADRWSLCWLVPAAAGVWMMVAAQSAVKDGVLLEQWCQRSIGELRTELEKTRWTITAGVLAGLAAAGAVSSLFVISGLGHQHPPAMGAFMYFWASPLLVLLQLRNAVRQPDTNITSITFFAQREVRPLISEHWGE